MGQTSWMFENINILNELKELNAETLIHTEKTNVFFVPDDYFTNLSNNITTQIWLNSVPRLNPFYLPVNYFENLPEIILDKLAIKNQLGSDKQVYEVPDGYFNNLASNIFNKIKAANNNVQQELEELAPLLSKLPKTNVYSVPAEYFENLVPQTESQKQPVKVVSIGKKTRRWIAYTAAACIAALMFGGGYYYFNENRASTGGKPSVNVNQYADIKVDQAISQLPDDAIDSYLKDDNSDIYIPQDDSQDVNIKMLLDNMSDEEINNYLRENSDPEENMKGS